jgi:hypothetical protein
MSNHEARHRRSQEGVWCPKVVVCQNHKKAEAAYWWRNPLQSTEPHMCLYVVTRPEKAGGSYGGGGILGGERRVGGWNLTWSQRDPVEPLVFLVEYPWQMWWW